MSERVCLRCDWRGATRDVVCPRCGATLFHAALTDEPAPTGRVGARPGRDGDEPADGERRTWRAPTARAWAGLVGLVLVVGLVVALISRATLDPPVELAPGDEGVLIFSEHHDDGWATLWAFDLEREALREGPRVRTPVELVDAYLAEEGWIGVTSEITDGQQASVFGSFGVGALDATLAQGRVVGWSPGGQSVAAARFDPNANGCGRFVVSTTPTESPSLGTRYRARRCDEPVAIGRDTLNPFVTLAGDGSVVTYEFPNRFEPTLVAPSGRLLGVGRDGDLVLQMPDPERIDPDGPVVPPSPSDPLVVVDQRLIGGPAMVVEVDGEALIPERALAFAFDGESVFVLGEADGRRGIWEVRLDLGDPTQPRFVAEADTDDVHLTASFDDSMVLLRDGELQIARRGGSFTPLELPGEAPAIEGPILLVPSLTYSAP